MSGFVLLRVVPRRCADRARIPRQRDDTRLADAHPASEGHSDAQFFSCFEKCCGAVDLRLLPGRGEVHRAALTAVVGAGDGESLGVQAVAQSAGLVVRFHLVEQRRWATRPAVAFAPVGHPFVESCGIEIAHLPGELESQVVAGGLRGPALHLVQEDDVVAGGGRMDVADVGRLLTGREGAQHRDHRRDPAARGDEQQFVRHRLREMEIALRRRQPDHGARLHAVDQMCRQEPVGIRLHRDRDGLVTGRADRGQRIRTPMPAATDLQADADVLTGGVRGRKTPAGTDGDGGRIGGLLDDVDDLAAELAGGPERIDQAEVVVGKQWRGGPRHQPAHDVDARLLGADIGGRPFTPFQQIHGSPHFRVHPYTRNACVYGGWYTTVARGYTGFSRFPESDDAAGYAAPSSDPLVH
ncbi:Uncharacterised protein [Nocardia africana]|uniref:Uncharacterized protein n=1 Tax=Nocardia africana TaxID=134964 RepID=A0A378X005_9NOCA|nr:Uncharacterised protein [Nocardia africana]